MNKLQKLAKRADWTDGVILIGLIAAIAWGFLRDDPAPSPPSPPTATAPVTTPRPAVRCDEVNAQDNAALADWQRRGCK